MPLVSVIIPVFNKWDLTRNCLKSLAETAREIEVVLVDNASTDITPKACPFLGKQLFGDGFQYLRNEVNKNFGPATNQGAKAARGEFLVFLNNDTELLPGWLEPLLKDFATLPRLGATGPLLLYPAREPLGHTVQHLGVCLTPFLNVRHLYEGIPADSPLAGKRRFFQVITAACMALPARLFEEAGMFDEHFVNGYEDVDLCARLAQKGLRMTVNPEARVIHFESQTEGRHAHEGENSRYLIEHTLPLLRPDWAEHVMADGLEAHLNHWQDFCPLAPARATASMQKLNLPFAGLLKLLTEQPYWQDGWKKLLALPEAAPWIESLAPIVFKLFGSPSTAIHLCETGLARGDMKMAREWLGQLDSFSQSFEQYCAASAWYGQWCREQGMAWLADQFAGWDSRRLEFKANLLVPFQQKYWRLNGLINKNAYPGNKYLYAAWHDVADAPARLYHMANFLHTNPPDRTDAPAFSLLLTLKGKEAWLASTIRAVLAQTWPHWELCIAAADTLDGESRQLLDSFADKRLRLAFAPVGRLNALALEMASKPWLLPLNPGEVLTGDALCFFAMAMAAKPEAELFYSDCDQLDSEDAFINPWFKGGWDPDLALAQNFLRQSAVFGASRGREIAASHKVWPGGHAFGLYYARAAGGAGICHVPHVLCHSHEPALAGAAEEGQTAEVAEFLRRNMPGAGVEQAGEFLRIRFPLPDKKPGLAIICAPGRQDRAGIARAWQGHDVIFIDQDSQDAAAAINRAVEKADADIVGIVSPLLVPAGPDWERAIIGALCREDIGACAGQTLMAKGTLLHGGYLVDAANFLRPVFRGADLAKTNWFGWTSCARTVDALDGICLFTRRRDFVALGGLARGENAFADYCLRLAKAGLRSLWQPEAVFRLGGAVALPQEARVSGIRPFNENLLICGPTFSLAAEGEFFESAQRAIGDFSAADYQLLYPDSKESGLDPLAHYLLRGRREGRKSHRRKLDYAAVSAARLKSFAAAPKGDVVVCTAIAGDYEKLLPPAFLNDGWRYVCYSDMPRENWGIWEMRDLPREEKDPTRRSRWPKLNLPQLFPQARWVFWVDANLVIAGDLSPLLANRPEDDFLFSSPHPVRDCLYAEGQACAHSGKERGETLGRQLAGYAEEGLPKHWGLYENGFFLLNPGHGKAADFFAQWWREYAAGARRDQISLPYVCYRNGIRPGRLFADGKSFRQQDELVFLTHEETRLIDPAKLNFGK